MSYGHEHTPSFKDGGAADQLIRLQSAWLDGECESAAASEQLSEILEQLLYQLFDTRGLPFDRFIICLHHYRNAALLSYCMDISSEQHWTRPILRQSALRRITKACQKCDFGKNDVAVDELITFRDRLISGEQIQGILDDLLEQEYSHPFNPPDPSILHPTQAIEHYATYHRKQQEMVILAATLSYCIKNGWSSEMCHSLWVMTTFCLASTSILDAMER
ncbi:MAG: hypothetical protein ACK526_13450 [Planctomyces sp.]|jgi:hypothetical protein